MAIHDRSVRGSGEKSPKPNSHDTQNIEQRMAHGTSSIDPVTDATDTNAFVQTKNGRILVNDGSYNRILIGVLPDGTFGMVISKSTYDVIDLFS